MQFTCEIFFLTAENHTATQRLQLPGSCLHSQPYLLPTQLVLSSLLASDDERVCRHLVLGAVAEKWQPRQEDTDQSLKAKILPVYSYLL